MLPRQYVDDQKSFCNNSYMYINIQLQEKGTTLKEGDEHYVLMEIWSKMELNAEKHVTTWKYQNNPS